VEKTLFFCETCGDDGARISDRLRLVGLDAGDRLLVRRLHEEVIAPHAQTITDAFYAELARHPDINRILAKSYDRDRLKRTFRGDLVALGLDFERPEYFDDRLRAGAPGMMRPGCPGTAGAGPDPARSSKPGGTADFR